MSFFSPLLLFLLEIFTIVSESCPDGSIASYTDKSLCYYFQSEKINFMAAEGVCIGLGGHLASIHSAFENAFVNEEASEIFTDSISSDLWAGANTLYKPRVWSWIDGTSFDFSDWDIKQPQNVSDNNCAAITLKNGRWNTQDCNNVKPFVCLIKDTTTTTTHPKPTSCQPSWTYYVVNGTTGYCYKVMDNATWIDAENNCKVDGAHLASIHTLDEALFLAYLAYWPGADVCDGYKLAWIGGHTDDNNAHWYWTDGTPFNYTAWPKPGGHPNGSWQRSCTLKYLTTQCQQPASTFDNWPCERLLAKYICKKSPE